MCSYEELHDRFLLLCSALLRIQEPQQLHALASSCCCSSSTRRTKPSDKMLTSVTSPLAWEASLIDLIKMLPCSSLPAGHQQALAAVGSRLHGTSAGEGEDCGMLHLQRLLAVHDVSVSTTE